ncbi:hypothetical protein DVH24_010353 [Malus domestica]|uniref:Cyclin C-terminal domain-containing protein n=1 Tax=Malus domestica TaxID=3750 RepID=A0A498JQH5_MALDO|nr:hypothetical protein DVH24_010353 [Malus domestica]
MYDPRLVAPTCLCLASKAEESTRQAKLLVFYIKKDLLLQDAGLNDTSMTQLTWGVVNDTYKMDLALVHPPHLIALACICIASVLRDKDTTAWFEELRVDMNVVSLPDVSASFPYDYA